MPKLPSFRVKKTEKGWLLHIPASVSDTAKLQRRYFTTRQKAQDLASELREKFVNHGKAASNLPPRVEGDAAAAWAILEPLGKSLVEAAWFLAADLEKRKASVNVDVATELYQNEKGDQSLKQVKVNRLMSARLCEKFPQRNLRSITLVDLLEYLAPRKGSPASYNQHVRLLSAFWRWCALPPREWVDVEVINGLARQFTLSKQIIVLFPDKAEILLRTAEKYAADMIPFYVIRLFMGVRKDEMTRLDASDITSDGVNVSADNSKTSARRYIHMMEPVLRWLEKYPIGETLLPSNWERKDKMVRRLAGWAVWSDLVEPHAPPDELPAWPLNALRHTAATVALASGKQIETLVFEHGHTGGLNTLKRHYIGVMTKAQANEILALRPMA